MLEIFDRSVYTHVAETTESVKRLDSYQEETAASKSYIGSEHHRRLKTIREIGTIRGLIPQTESNTIKILLGQSVNEFLKQPYYVRMTVIHLIGIVDQTLWPMGK